MEHFKAHPSSYMARELEEFIDEPIDFEDADLIWDERPHGDYSHIPDSGSDEPY